MIQATGSNLGSTLTNALLSLTQVGVVRRAAVGRAIEPTQRQEQGPRSTTDTVEISRAAREATGPVSETELTEEEQKEVEELRRSDREVRAHEQAHKAAAGPYGGPISYTFRTGPDGKRYAVGGEVPVDLSSEGDPARTIQKMQAIQQAAVAPSEPSSGDRRTAARAQQIEREARHEQAGDKDRTFENSIDVLA